MTRNQSVSRSRTRADPAGVVPGGDADERADHHRRRAVAAKPTSSEIREPQMQQRQHRAAALVGAERVAAGTAGCSSSPVALVTSSPSSCGRAAGAKIATRMKTISTPSPTNAGLVAPELPPEAPAAARAPRPGQRPRRARWRPRPRRRRLGGRAHAAAPAGRARRTTQVGDQVGDDHPGREQQEDALQQRDVRHLDRLVRQQPEARPGEHGLDRDRAGDHEADVEQDQRDRRAAGRSGTACRRRTIASVSPLARAVVQVVLAQSRRSATSA